MFVLDVMAVVLDVRLAVSIVYFARLPITGKSGLISVQPTVGQAITEMKVQGSVQYVLLDVQLAHILLELYVVPVRQ